ncbi:MAG: hypothetical protein KDA80_17890 [Planctomycetaceae bacterium]|nr:hypothetical protein [Planctomycetaceae bacterium]
MRMKLALAAALVLSVAHTSFAKDIYGLEPGPLELKSATTMTFGPSGILFVGDAQAATIYAIQTGDTKGDAANAKYNIENLSKKVAEALNADNAQITDLAVNPASGHLFLGVQTGQKAAIVKIENGNMISPVDLGNIAHSKATLPNAAEDKEVGEGRRRRNNRGSSITDLAFVDGELIVSGLANDDTPTNVWSLVFPFQSVDKGTSLEIYHAAHGRSESYPAIQTFIPFMIDGEAHVLAGFTCTPLVKFPVSKLTGKAAEQLEGTTVAELGNRNRPLDMISYEKDGSNYLLLANSARGVMKIGTDKLSEVSLSEPVRGGGQAGQDYVTIESMDGVVQLDKLNDTHAVLITQAEGGPAHLKTVELP